ncbi:hypothetical protein HK405_002174, partial [Cladochytrium tenue]
MDRAFATTTELPATQVRVLLTGFGAFGRYEHNPSYAIVSSFGPSTTLHAVGPSGRRYAVILQPHPDPVRVAYATVDSLVPALWRARDTGRAEASVATTAAATPVPTAQGTAPDPAGPPSWDYIVHVGVGHA